MADTIIDYIKKTQNETLMDRPFCEVDSLILSQLSYLKFDGMVPIVGSRDSAVTLPEIGAMNTVENLFQDERYRKPNTQMFEALISSERFNKMKLHSYINIIDHESESQFAAITFEFENGVTYVAFRGTDENLVGWKEDLNLSMAKPVPGQLKSVEYLETVAKYIDGKFIVGGHSKGGNLSVFSAMYCHPLVCRRITDIYNHDGPGMRNEIMDDGRYRAIRDRIRMTVPESSVVGMLLINFDNYKVVQSKKVGLMQHDPYGWKVKDNHFVEAEEITKKASLMDRSINEWVMSLDEEQLKFFMDTVYEVMLATGEDNLNGIISNWTNVVPRVANTLKDIDQETKDAMHKLFSGLMELNDMNVRSEINERIEELKAYTESLSEQAKKRKKTSKKKSKKDKKVFDI